MQGFLGRIMGSWRQPDVKGTERSDVEGQWDVPKHKIFGVFLCLAVALPAFWIFTLTFPPQYVVEATAYVGSIAAIVLGVLTFSDWGYAAYLKREREPTDACVRAGILHLVLTVSVAAITYTWVHQSHGDWWFEFLDPRILNLVRLVDIAALIAGVMGAYWFIKELIVPWELTGLNRVIMEIVKRYLPQMIQLEMAQAGGGEVEGQTELLDGLRTEIVGEVTDALEEVRAFSKPMKRDHRTATLKMQRAHQGWAMDVMAFVVLSQWWGYMSRKKWVDDVAAKEYAQLPSGLKVDHSVHPLMIAQLEDIGVVQRTNKGPVLDLSSVSAEQAAGQIALLDCPEKYRGRYT